MPCRWASYNEEGTHTKFRPLPSHILPIHESPTANGQLCMPHWATFVRQWNDRVRAFTSHTTSKARSDICFRHHWNLARYLATLPEHSWIRRFLGSKGQRCIGPPKYCWQAGSASHFRAQALNFAYVFFSPCRLDRGMFSSKDCLLVFFFFLPQEGSLVQGCFTGQPPGTDCVYTGQSPDVLLVGKV